MRKILGAVLAFGPLLGLVYAIEGWEAVMVVLGTVAFLGLIVIGAVLMVSD